MAEKRAISVKCGSCGVYFGRLGDEGQGAVISIHYQTCTEYLSGEGLKQEKPIAYAFEDERG